MRHQEQLINGVSLTLEVLGLLIEALVGSEMIA